VRRHRRRHPGGTALHSLPTQYRPPTSVPARDTGGGGVSSVRRRGRLALAAVVAVLAVTGPLAGVTAASVGPTGPVTADDGDVDAGTVTAGNVATIDVRLPDGVETATFEIDEPDATFRANATLHDRDGDGLVTVALDTAAAGNGDASSYLSARDEDELSDATQFTPASDGGLDPFAYDVNLVRDGDAVADDTLFVEPDETDGNETATGSFHYEGDRLTLSAADNQVVRGETSLPSGTEVRVLLDAGDARDVGGVRWVKTVRDATVTEDGTFDATFDLAGYGPNVTFRARLLHEQTPVTSAPGRLAACERDCLGTDEVRVLDGVEVDQYRTAEIPVTFGDGDRLNVTVTNTSGPAYRLNATVHDTDGDGRATLLFRTAPSGDEPVLLVRENGETRPADVASETTSNRTLPAALYQVTARIPGDRDAWDTGTLVVFERNSPPADGTAVPETTPEQDGADSSADPVTSTPETPDPLEVQTDGEDGGIDLLPLGSVGAGGLVAVAGLLRLLRR